VAQTEIAPVVRTALAEPKRRNAHDLSNGADDCGTRESRRRVGAARDVCAYPAAYLCPQLPGPMPRGCCRVGDASRA